MSKPQKNKGKKKPSDTTTVIKEYPKNGYAKEAGEEEE